MEGDSDSENEGGGGGGADGAMIMPQSRPIVEDEIAAADLPEAAKDLHFWAKQNDLAQIRARVNKGADVNARDEEGRTSVWTCRTVLGTGGCAARRLSADVAIVCGSLCFVLPQSSPLGR